MVPCEDISRRKEVGGMDKALIRCVSWYLVLAMFIIGIAPRVEAGLSPSEAIALSTAERLEDIAKIQKALESKLVGERLGQLGLTQEEVRVRLGSLSDRQLHEIALRADELMVGGNGAEVLIIVLLVAILVVLILHYTGRKIIVK
jgi:hypothetical protein